MGAEYRRMIFLDAACTVVSPAHNSESSQQLATTQCQPGHVWDWDLSLHATSITCNRDPTLTSFVQLSQFADAECSKFASDVFYASSPEGTCTPLPVLPCVDSTADVASAMLGAPCSAFTAADCATTATPQLQTVCPLLCGQVRG